MTKKHQFIVKRMLTVLAEKGIKQGFDTELGGIGSFVNNSVSCLPATVDKLDSTV